MKIYKLAQELEVGSADVVAIVKTLVPSKEKIHHMEELNGEQEKIVSRI